MRFLDCVRWLAKSYNQNIFVQSAVNGGIFGTCLAFFVILVATRSPIMAVAATATIACILVCVVGTMDMLGWCVRVYACMRCTRAFRALRLCYNFYIIPTTRTSSRTRRRSR